MPPTASGPATHPPSSPPGTPPPRTYARDHDAWRLVQPLLPASMRTRGHEPAEEAWSWRGSTVHLDRYAVPDAPATAIVLHGAGGHGRLLASAGRIVRDAGLEAVMPDLPGYGLTVPAPGHRRYPAWVALVADLVRAERARSGRPVVLAGMSLGGMLAWHAASVLPPGTVAAVVATNLLDPGDPEVQRAVARWPAVGARSAALLRWTPRPLHGVRLPLPLVANAAGMSNDPAVVRALLADRRGTGSHVAIGFLRSWFAYRPPVAPEAWAHGPVLLAHPGDDRWTPTALSRRFFDRLPAPKRFVELERCGHLPTGEPGLSAFVDEIGTLAARLRDGDLAAGCP